MELRTNLTSPRSRQGFTIIELMIVVAIISVLAVIAIPAYLDYAGRSKVSEGMLQMDGAKPRILEFEHFNGRMPSSNAELGIAGDQYWGRYVSTLNLADGDIRIIFNSTNTPFAPDQNELMFRADTGSMPGSIIWVCSIGDRTIQEGYRPRPCR